MAILTVYVFDAVTKHPIANAKVTVDTAEAYTNEAGIAAFTITPPITIPPPPTPPPVTILPVPPTIVFSVLVKASKHGYVEASKRVTVTEAGATVELGLVPIWVFPVGILAAGGLILLGTKALKWW
jgi:hypothetical protein